MPDSPYLALDSLVTGYGKKTILNGVSLNVAQGEIVALIGHNGAGKSSLLKAIFGLLPIWNGKLFLNGVELCPPVPRSLLKAGVVYLPQGNRVFNNLTVHENLEMGGVTLISGLQLKEGIDKALDLFPALIPRLCQRAGTLSGGEKQMLALAKALVLSPRFLLLDEPSLGLSPYLVSQALQQIRDISEQSGVATLIVEQKVREVFKIARRVYVLRNGVVSFSGLVGELEDAKLREVYF